MMKFPISFQLSTIMHKYLYRTSLQYILLDKCTENCYQLESLVCKLRSLHMDNCCMDSVAEEKAHKN